jgi:hypothetical protein
VENYVVSLAFVVFLLTLASLLRKWYALSKLARKIPRPPTLVVPEQGHFHAESFEQTAETFFDCFRTANRHHILGQFDLERHLTPLSMQIRTLTSSARAVSGILILLALLITLYQLRKAVSDLSTTFDQVAQHSAAAEMVSRVQTSMSGVASSAATAFRISGYIILFAVTLLAVAAGAQKYSLTVLRRMSAWALLLHNHYLAEAASGGGSNDFTAVITSFRDVIRSFEGLQADLSAIGSFRADLVRSADAITDAVKVLPTQIQGNMDRLSSGAFREIADHLDKHYDVLCKVLAIYGDQEMRMKEIQALARDLNHQNTELTSSLMPLKEVTPSLGKLTTAVDSWTSATDRLVSSADQLDAKIDRLPLPQIEDAVTHAKAAAERLIRLQAESTQLLQNWSELLPEWKMALSADRAALLEAVRQSLGELNEKLKPLKVVETLDAKLVESIRSSADDTRKHLVELENLVQRSDHAAQLGILRETVDEIRQLTAAPLWKRIVG